MEISLIERIKWAGIVWLARRLPDCRTMTVSLGESIDGRLNLKGKIIARLHLLTCEACKRYLHQIKFIKQAMSKHERKLTDDVDTFNVKMSDGAKSRLKTLLRTTQELPGENN